MHARDKDDLAPSATKRPGGVTRSGAGDLVSRGLADIESLAQAGPDAREWYERGYRCVEEAGAEYPGLPGLYEEARRCFRRAAEQGLAEAQFVLSGLYAGAGDGLCDWGMAWTLDEEEPVEAARWCRQAADQGLANAQWVLGAMLLQGYGVKKDEAEGRRWRNLAAQQGGSHAHELGMAYRLGVSAIKKADTATFWAYPRGVGEAIDQDFEEALRWFRVAAEEGNDLDRRIFIFGAFYYQRKDSQLALGQMYAEGQGAPRDDVAAADWYRLAADQDQREAQCHLGEMYRDGRGVAQNDVEALHWFRRATAGRPLDAAYQLARLNVGWMYANGRGTAQDDREAVRWYRAVAERNNGQGAYYLGTMYEAGRGVVQDVTEAVRWYTGAAQAGWGPALEQLGLLADQGQADAQVSVGHTYVSNPGISGYPRDLEKAVQWYQRAADRGHAEAQYQMAISCLKGRGLQQDDVQAAVWYRRAAEQDHGSAQYQLGEMYLAGSGVSQDDVAAMEWFRRAASEVERNWFLHWCQRGLKSETSLSWEGLKAEGIRPDQLDDLRAKADEGDLLSQMNLGLVYYYGLSVAQDTTAAAGWFRRASDAGDDEGQWILGRMHRDGEGVPQDDDEAVRLFRLAVGQADSYAHTDLGEMYRMGRGVSQDDEEAVRLFRLLAEPDDPDGRAMFRLGNMYREGLGVEQNTAEATRLYMNACVWSY